MQGLVLTAGGARGAYQAGVLKRLSELPSLRGRPSPFAIVAGASAGAINGAILAARSEGFADAASEVAAVWSGLEAAQVYRTDLAAFACRAASLAHDFVLGGVLGRTLTHGLLDTSPLEALLARVFPRRGIADGIARGDVYAVAVTATSYHSGRSFTFVQGRAGHPIWQKSRRVVLPVRITHRHILASGAIPIVFPPVQIASSQGELWFGDGGLRLVTPLSPAIRLGATHLLAIGVRSSRAADNLAREEASGDGPSSLRLFSPPLAQVCGVFMNAIFLDHLDADLDHLKRMNELVAAHAEATGDGRTSAGPEEPMRVVTPLLISPSEDLALVAQRFAHRMPRLLRIALDGLGTPDAQSADLMSYLLFDSSYTRTLVDIGYADAAARADEIEAFLASSGALERKRNAPRAIGRRLAPIGREHAQTGSIL
ncbi:MAG TPA: patatin-like phospholipase family protein [Myxococcota bacterium]|nr:patatin-like phospholipase family protein [Myxococcota bacterium]